MREVVKILHLTVSTVSQNTTSCRERGIRLNREKSMFAQSKIDFAGVTLDGSGYRIQEKILKAIREFNEPQTLTDLRSFQGMANQLSPFNRDLATAMEPLRPLLKKSDKFEMNDLHREAFNEAKRILVSERVIAYYRPGAPMQLYTDASVKNGLGFHLKQKQEDGAWKVIQTGSRSLQDAETRYAPIELELLAVVYAVRKCKVFLAGAEFKVFTDHRPLVTICNKRRLDEVDNVRILRSLIKLMDFNFSVEYIPGSENQAADAFSRYPVDPPGKEDKNFDMGKFYLNTLQNARLEEADCSLRDGE